MKLLQMITCPELFIPTSNKITNAITDTARVLLDSVGAEHKTKVVMFANFQQSVEFLAERFKDFNPAVIYGKSSNKESEKKKFLHDESCRLLIANPISAGVGLNLQSVCHTVIFVEPAGVAGWFKQASERVHRNGQKKPVSIYILSAMDTGAPKITKNMRRKEEDIRNVNLDRESLMDYFCIST